ncbi:response regulator transcription factor [Desulfosarcina ovata]|uniref:Transcriptional regulator n=1 Tax=Desulfosarcina ovata subsp. ovata TaxID=2752305 RepID=A0A5K8AP13_9BACT|nr:response regulator [Desulfosarcina ovata]BBO93364.1 transcriptional regulator [Desulfosarcina ovata subsp. ovata]
MSTVLVVDDDEKIRKFVSMVLKKEGFYVAEARNGQEGFFMYNTQSPDLVLIDIIMPEKDGLSAIREIKAINGMAKVVAMSGGLVLTPDAYLDEAKEIGADCVLSKPFDRRKLVETVQNLLL